MRGDRGDEGRSLVLVSFDHRLASEGRRVARRASVQADAVEGFGERLVSMGRTEEGEQRSGWT